MPLERIDKIIASQGGRSRREAGALIRSGAVLIGGVPALRPEQKADPGADEILVLGVPLNYRKYVYLMMNKPSGVLSAARDARRKTVLDLVPPGLSRRGLFPAGRLDRDTEGLLILTDDGDFAHRMLAPKSHVYKLYEALLDRPATPEDVLLFQRGISLGDRDALPAGLEILPGCRARVRVCEGKFHQVKRMFQAAGKTVLYLKRLAIGALELDEALPLGGVRILTNDERESVFR